MRAEKLMVLFWRIVSAREHETDSSISAKSGNAMIISGSIFMDTKLCSFLVHIYTLWIPFSVSGYVHVCICVFVALNVLFVLWWIISVKNRCNCSERTKNIKNINDTKDRAMLLTIVYLARFSIVSLQWAFSLSFACSLATAFIMAHWEKRPGQIDG